MLNEITEDLRIDLTDRALCIDLHSRAQRPILRTRNKGDCDQGSSKTTAGNVLDHFTPLQGMLYRLSGGIVAFEISGISRFRLEGGTTCLLFHFYLI